MKFANKILITFLLAATSVPATVCADSLTVDDSKTPYFEYDPANFAYDGVIIESGAEFVIASNLDADLNFAIENSGTLRIAGTGTMTLKTQISTAGTIIVDTGTLNAEGMIQNAELEVRTGATFKLGSSGAVFTGTAMLDDGAKFVFGGGNETYFQNSKILGAGTVNLDSGTAIFANSEIQAADVNVAGTLQVGTADELLALPLTIDGNVNLLAGTSENWGGQLVVYSNLKISGDLNCSSTLYQLSSDGTSWSIYSHGSVVTLVPGATLEVAGTAKLGGVLYLPDVNYISAGTVCKIFSAGTIDGDWDGVTVGDHMMLVTAGVAGIGENEFGVARVENKNLRERDFTAHHGLGEFIDYLNNSSTGTQSNRPNEVAQAVALASAGTDLTNTVNAFSPLVFSAFPAIAVAQSVSEVDYLRRAFAPGLSAPASDDGIHVEKNLQFFSNFQYESTANREQKTSPIFDFQSLGVLAGAYSWVDDERLVGASLGVYHATAWAHGYSRSHDKLGDSALRLRIFAGMMPAWASWNFIFGAHVGGHYYDIERPTALGTTDADEFGMEAGLFGVWNMKIDLKNGWEISPFVRVDFNYLRVDTIRESASSKAALNVDAFGYATWQTRAGTSIDKVFTANRRGLKTAIGVDFALMANIHSDTKLHSEFVNYSDSATTSTAYIEDDWAFEFSPHLRAQLPHNWQLDCVYRVRVGDEGDWSHAISIGVSSAF